MEQGSSHRRRYVGTFVVLLGLLCGLLGMVGPWADASPVPPGVLGNFEIEGDQTSAPGGTIDWVDVDPAVLIDKINPDDGLQGSSKENEPEEFACQDKSPTVTPGKDNLVRAYINSRVTGLDSMFLDLGFVRSDGGTQGDSHVNFEFNQNPITDMCPYTGRADGDLLITFDFPGNAADPADVQTFSWDADAPDAPDAPGKWVSFAFSAARADDNTAIITDQVVGGSIAARAFGEATIDLLALFEASGHDDGCASFGFASVRSRSSGESFSSALQDILGGPVDVTTCGKVIVHKTDDAGNNLPGATFGLWPAAASVPPVVNGARAATGSVDTCVSIANGTCTFDDVDPGDYKVAEISAPSGYDIDPDVVNVTVGFRETVTVQAAFVDPKDTGSVTITKRIWDDKNGNDTVDAGEILDLKVSGGVVYHDIDHNGSKSADEPAIDLTGITFVLLDSNDDPASTWPPPGSPAECTIPAGSLSCTIGPVVLGSYTITEEVDPAKPLPDGVGIGPNVAVNINVDDGTVNATYTNPISPLNIHLEKSGPDTANVGDTYTYTFDVSTTGPRLHDVTVVELIPDRCTASALTGPNKSVSVDADNDSDEFLEVGETWRWTCQHLVVAADGTSIHNEARATGTDDVGREVSDDDPHDVTVLRPDLQVVKLADDGVDEDGDDSADETVDAPGTATYTITVTNEGPGIARNATLEDDLPAGTWTVTLASPDGDDDCPTGAGNTRSGSFSCTFGDIGPNDPAKVITVTRPVTLEADCAATLENNAGVETTYQDVNIDTNGDNDESSATIHVRCPDAGVTKTAAEPVVDAGGRAVWNIVVTNNGDGDATDVHISDDLPSALSDWQVTAPQDVTCGIVLGHLACSLPTLAGGDSRTITISGLTDNFDCGVIPNAVDLVDGQGADYDDTNDENDSDSDSVDVRCPIEIDLDKTGDTIAHVGDTVDYEFTVTNVGGEDLVNVVLTDPECNAGSITLVDDADGDTTLAKGTWDGDSFEGGEVWSYTCQRTITAEDVVEVDGQNFALNTGTVTAEDEDERPVDDTDPHEVLIITPDIEIVKTVDDETPLVGQTVTYTYVVTNTGDTDLFDIQVTDDVLGDIGTIDELAPGESATLTKDMVVAADSPTLNVATADGEDVLGKHVDDDDDAEITIVLPEVIERPQPLPKTGANIDRLVALAGLLLLIGGAFVLTSTPATARARHRRQ